MTDEEREKQRKYDREYYRKMLPFQKEKRKEAARLRNKDNYWKLTDEERQLKKDKSLAYYYANIEALKIKAKAYRERKLKSKYE
jgi:hypothetical protein